MPKTAVMSSCLPDCHVLFPMSLHLSWNGVNTVDILLFFWAAETRLEAIS
jgi:hypothetical protein